MKYTTTEIYMKEHQLERKKCFIENQEQLIKMRDTKKSTRYRKWLYCQLERLSDIVFKDWEDEVREIGKFDRGMWSNIRNTFKCESELNFIIKIAREYGAFDY